MGAFDQRVDRGGGECGADQREGRSDDHGGARFDALGSGRVLALCAEASDQNRRAGQVGEHPEPDPEHCDAAVDQADGDREGARDRAEGH